MQKIDIVNPAVEQYVEQQSSPVDADLQKLERETYLNVLQPHMLSGSFQGKFLEFVSQLVKPQNILEIGTFTGYSALCLAKGLQPNGQLHTIDVNEELMERTKQVFADSSYSEQIHLHIGNAMEIVPNFSEQFDLVFIDADKANYLNYFQLVVDKVRAGGIILVDNVLWKGKVILQEKDKKTQAMHVFNETITNDPRVENLLLPIRDGVMWIVKK